MNKVLLRLFVILFVFVVNVNTTKSVQKPTRSKRESSKEKPKTPVPQVMMYTTSETSMDDVDDGLGDDLSADILRNLIEY